MLESSRDQVRAAEALLQIYDYFLTATEQLARAECHDGLPHTAPDIGRSRAGQGVDHDI
jgi:hypothetical protein